MDGLRAVSAAHGVFLRSEALTHGLDDRGLARAVADGSLHRVRHGAYAFGDVWAVADLRQRHQLLARAVYRTSIHEVTLSHTSAVLEHTDAHWGLDLSRAHVTRLDGKAGRRTSYAASHRGKIVAGDIARTPSGLLVTSPVRAALELTTVAGLEPALVSINAMLHAGLCTSEELELRYASGVFQWPATLVTDLVLRLADPRMTSVGETRTFCLLRNIGLPAPEPQYEVFDLHGDLFAKLDFAWPALGVWVEFDGKEKYVNYLLPGETPADAVFREKRREDRVRELTGWQCIRLTWADLSRPELVHQRIAEALRRARVIA